MIPNNSNSNWQSFQEIEIENNSLRKCTKHMFTVFFAHLLKLREPMNAEGWKWTKLVSPMHGSSTHWSMQNSSQLYLWCQEKPVSLVFCFIYCCNDFVNLSYVKEVYCYNLCRLLNMYFKGKENFDLMMQMTVTFETNINLVKSC